MTPRLREHLRAPVAGALAMFVMELARTWCPSCSPWNMSLRAVVAGFAGALAGLLLSLLHERFTRIGVVGEYLLGVATAWFALATLQYFWPFVWDSFFYTWRLNYGALLGLAAIYGLVVTLDLRLRSWRQRRHVPGLSSADRVPWQSRLGLPTQILAAFTILFLCAVVVRTYSAVLYADYSPDAVVLEWEAWVEQHPADPEAHFGLARALLEVQRWDEARAAAQEAVRLDADIARYHEVLGWSDLGLGEDRKALEHFWAAARRDRADARLWRDLGRLAHMVGEWDQAREAYEHMASISPNRLFWAEEDRDRWAELFGGG